MYLFVWYSAVLLPLSLVTAVFGVCTCVQCVSLQCVCIYVYNSAQSNCYHCVFFKICFLSGRLQKSHLEKGEFEDKLKDLQDSLLTMKKQIPSSDNKHSLEKVIHMLVIRQSTDYVCCVGEMQGLLCFIVCVFF